MHAEARVQNNTSSMTPLVAQTFRNQRVDFENVSEQKEKAEILEN
jgi:hypothetical protein